MSLRTVENYFEAELHAPVSKAFVDATTITGAVLLSVWTPTGSTRFILKGWNIVAVVRTALAAANPCFLGLWDNSTAAPAVGLAAFEATAPIGSQFLSVSPVRFEGFPSATATNVLKLGTNITIGSGVISVFGMVWGSEEA